MYFPTAIAILELHKNKTSVLLMILLPVVMFTHTSKAVRFIYQPTNQSTVEGKRAHVTCILEDTGDMENNYDIIWTKDTLIISEPTNGFDQNRFSFHNDYAERRHFLRIDPVEREDEGVYKCHVRYNSDIVLTSKSAKLTVRGIPSDDYPIVYLSPSTYKCGEEIMTGCFCEKINPNPKLELFIFPTQILKPTEKHEANDTHIWIVATVRATRGINGSYFECKLKVNDEVAPRYKYSKTLHIIDNDMEALTLPQTEKQYVTGVSPGNELKTGSKTYSGETSITGGTPPLAYRLEVVVIKIVCVSVIFVVMII